jgi:hypothetical protein
MQHHRIGRYWPILGLSGALSGLLSCSPTPTLDASLWQDPATGLIWQRCSVGQQWVNDHCEGSAEELTWWKALQAAQQSRINQKQDWRVPTRQELASIFQEGQVGYRVPDHALQLPSTGYAGTYWSSSDYADDRTYAWQTLFNLGVSRAGAKSYSLYVRLVRAGKPDGQFTYALDHIAADEQRYRQDQP